MLTIYFKRKPPASVYAVRNEQGFHTLGVFSCDAFSFRLIALVLIKLHVGYFLHFGFIIISEGGGGLDHACITMTIVFKRNS